MNITTFANDYIFPIILFFVLVLFLHDSDLLNPELNNNLELFFEQIIVSIEICELLNSLTNKEEFISTLLDLSHQLGYPLNITQIEQ